MVKHYAKTIILDLAFIIEAQTEDELPEWNVAMAGTLLVMLPPVFVVMVLQNHFVKGLLGGDK